MQYCDRYVVVRIGVYDEDQILELIERQNYQNKGIRLELYKKQRKECDVTYV